MYIYIYIYVCIYIYIYIYIFYIYTHTHTNSNTTNKERHGLLLFGLAKGLPEAVEDLLSLEDQPGAQEPDMVFPIIITNDVIHLIMIMTSIHNISNINTCAERTSSNFPLPEEPDMARLALDVAAYWIRLLVMLTASEDDYYYYYYYYYYCYYYYYYYYCYYYYYYFYYSYYYYSYYYYYYYYYYYCYYYYY